MQHLSVSSQRSGSRSQFPTFIYGNILMKIIVKVKVTVSSLCVIKCLDEEQ